ncbi:DUF885 domain-containing protein [Balneola sp. MJW-20]|uniref:DUF885 domain-containing protein n=1 Tax=Gracilimonas aurantiaca TaxID=3234185 RepID=UPI003464FA51
MKLNLLVFSTLLTAFIWSACSSPAPDKPIDQVFEEYYQERLQFNPFEATNIGIQGYNDQFPDLVSEEYLTDLKDFYQRYVEEVKKYDTNGLSQEQAISREVLLWDLQAKIDGLDQTPAVIASPIYGLPMFDLMPLTQFLSMHLYMGQLGSGTNAQPFETVEDYDNWLTRMDGYFVFLETARERMDEGIEKGYVWPKILTERMIGQLEPLITDPLEEHLFYQPIVNMPESISDTDRQRLTDAYASMIMNQFKPTHRELKNYLENTYLPAGPTTEASGIGAMPGGQELYQYMIRINTSTDLTADEIHQIGLDEVDRIRGEMMKVKNEVGFEGDLESFFDHVRSKPELMPFDDPQQVIENFERIHEVMKPYLKDLFDMTPKAGFVVRRTEAFREASASAQYNTGSKDGSRPGIFYVPIPDVDNYNMYADESLFLHEAIPGHHYQLSLQQENAALPEFMHAEGLGVYVEGWALYTEALGHELGLYKDPYQYFGNLSSEMHRAIRLVVDTGIHAKGWTREEAIEYSLNNEAESEASITSEIERYMSMPGQALSYKIGQLKIIELRERAKEELGDAFSIKEFHNQVLNTGSLPLEVLETKIDRWISAEKDAMM